jgi:hypothetical protein
LVQRIAGGEVAAFGEKKSRNPELSRCSAAPPPDSPVYRRQCGFRRIQSSLARLRVSGSLLGLAPGIVVTNLFAHQLENAIRHPGPGTIVILAALVVITALGAVWFKRKFATA